MNELDQVTVHLDESSIFYLNLSLGFIMFGVALKLTLKDFFLVFTHPKAVLIGFVSQFFALPFLTFLLILLFQPIPSVALGMIIIAACPGGNISNFMTATAKGNIALSVCITAISSICAVFMTPLNISIWGGMYAPTAEILESVNLDLGDMVKIIAMILIVPLIAGMLVRQYKPRLADRLHPFTHYGSIFIFAAIVFLVFRANFDNFIAYVHLIIFIVLVHNATGILSGLGLAKIFKLPPVDQKTLAIETGIQNSGLGLGLIFTFFDGLGGMAIVAGWWGIWHIISGLSLAYFFKNRKF